jgi:hypothetical protein
MQKEILLDSSMDQQQIEKPVVKPTVKKRKPRAKPIKLIIEKGLFTLEFK